MGRSPKTLSLATPIVSYVVFLFIASVGWKYAQSSVESRIQIHVANTIKRRRNPEPASRLFLIVYGMYLIAEVYYHTFLIGLLLLCLMFTLNVLTKKENGKDAEELWYSKIMTVLETMTPQHALDHAFVFVTLSVVSTTWILVAMDAEDLRDETRLRRKFARVRAMLPALMVVLYLGFLFRDFLAIASDPSSAP
jgi:hypothetical protein